MNTEHGPKILVILTLLTLLTSCSAPPTQQEVLPPSQRAAVSTDSPQANMANPASVYCEQQGNKSEIRAAADGSQSGVCVFPDGSECDEWAYFRGECEPASQSGSADPPTEIPTAMPIDPADYQGFWTYTHAVYNFSIMLPEDWVVDESTASDPLMNGHLLMLRPRAQGEGVEGLEIRMTFRRAGEEDRLWPTGVGQGEFIPQGALDIAGQPARRILLICPSGEITAIWYHDAEEDQPNIARGGMEFGFIFSAGSHCEPGYSLGGKTQRTGEMIIASLNVP